MTIPSKTNNNVRIARRHLQSRLKNDFAYPPLPYEYKCSGAPEAQEAPVTSLHEDPDAVECVSEAELGTAVNDGRPIEAWRERTFAESDPSSGDELPVELQGIESLYSNTATFADAVQTFTDGQPPSSSADAKKDKRKRDLLFHSKAKRRSWHESKNQANVEGNPEPVDHDDSVVLVNGAGSYQRPVRRGRDVLEARRRAARRQRRNERFRAEMEWNPGLAHWAARRDAWTSACKVRAVPRSESDTSGNVSRSSQDMSEMQATVTSTSGLTMSADEAALAEDAFAPPVRTLLPVPTPLLTTDNPDPTLRIPIITPQLYPSIYSRLVIQSVSPSVPINLSHMISALVQGWKADGEWPPQPSKPAAMPQPESKAPRRRQKKQKISAPAVASAVETLRATDQITKRALRSIGLGGSHSTPHDDEKNATLQPPPDSATFKPSNSFGTTPYRMPLTPTPVNGDATHERHHRRQQSSPGNFQKAPPVATEPKKRAKAHSLSIAGNAQRDQQGSAFPNLNDRTKRFVELVRPGTSGSISTGSSKMVPSFAAPEDLGPKSAPLARPPTVIDERVAEEEREADDDAVQESRDSGISGISETRLHNKEVYREIDQVESVDERSGLTLREALLQDPEVLLDGAPSATFEALRRDTSAVSRDTDNIGDNSKTSQSASLEHINTDAAAGNADLNGTHRIRKKSSMDVVKSGIVKVVKTATGLAGSNAGHSHGHDGVDTPAIDDDLPVPEEHAASWARENQITEEMEAFALPGATAEPTSAKVQEEYPELCANASLVRGYSLSYPRKSEHDIRKGSSYMQYT